MRRKQIINVKVLPGEPLDGTGKVCIHLFVQDDRGPFVEPYVLHMDESEGDHGQIVKQLVSRPTRGRLACSASRTVAPITRNGVTTVTMRTSEVRAVTCLKCIASSYYAEAMNLLATV